MNLYFFFDLFLTFSVSEAERVDKSDLCPNDWVDGTWIDMGKNKKY